VARRGRFGVFAGCSRYPDCDYIHRTGPPPPPPLPFDVECPRCGQGTLVARRARRTGSLFHGCSRYPDCDFTTSLQPLGALHEADAGAVAAKDEGAMCLRCGASIDLPSDGADLVGRRLPGGPPDPAALRPSRKRRVGGSGAGRSGRGRGRRGASTDASTSSNGSGRRRRAASAAP
jgi:ssDNA-binding Zn-finger/Zn-ribbon topoisomerase 1